MRLEVNKDVNLSWWQAKTFLKACHTRVFSFLAARQEGKTFLGRTIIKDFMFKYNKRKNPIFIIVTPYCAQAADLYFKGIWEELEPIQDKILFKQGSEQTGRIIITMKRKWFNDAVTVVFSGAQNLRGLRGRTADAALIDELAFCNEDLYTEVIRPMTKRTRGKIFLTSTVNGHNHFYDICNMNEDSDDHRGKHIEFDIATCQQTPFVEVLEEYDHYKRQGKIVKFYQENMNIWNAVDVGESPFGTLARSVSKRGRTIHDKTLLDHSRTLFCVIDRGSPGNNAAWIGVEVYGEIYVYEYIDILSNIDLIKYVAEKYPKHYIQMVYPHDINTTATADGKPEIETLIKVIEKLRLNRRINTKVLGRPKNKQFLIEKTVSKMRDINFYIRDTDEGISKIAKVMHPKNKDGVIDYTKFDKKSKCDHAADAMCYLVEAHDLGWLREIVADSAVFSQTPISLTPNRKVRPLDRITGGQNGK